MTQGRILAAHALGDKLVDIDFKDAVSDVLAITMTTICNHEDTIFPTVPVVNALYEQTQVQSKLRQLLVHDSRSQPGFENILAPTDHPEFLFEYAVYGKKTEESTIAAVARCAFHEHTLGAENCYRARYGATAHHFADWYIIQEADGEGTDKQTC